jgi:hypothetical protein
LREAGNGIGRSTMAGRAAVLAGPLERAGAGLRGGGCVACCGGGVATASGTEALPDLAPVSVARFSFPPPPHPAAATAMAATASACLRTLRTCRGRTTGAGT